MIRWSLTALADQLAEILAAREEALRLEQAVHGLDVVKEQILQALLEEGLRECHSVAREQHYPSSDGKLSHRRRCDLVLSPLDAPFVPEQALWLELKIAQQLRPGGRPNGRYGAQWRRAIISDLRKMGADPRIAHAALALVVFTDDQRTLEKDLGLFEALLADEELLAGFRSVRSFPIVDRIGHGLCSVALWPTLASRTAARPDR